MRKPELAGDFAYLYALATAVFESTLTFAESLIEYAREGEKPRLRVALIAHFRSRHPASTFLLNSPKIHCASGLSASSEILHQ